MAIPMPDVSRSAADPVPFLDAIEWIRLQAPWISGSSWQTMANLAALKGDEVSAATCLGMLDDVWGGIDRAVAEGLPYGDFLRGFEEPFRARWYEFDSARLRLIYHNNVGNALMAGRLAQLTDPVVMEARPWWLVDAIMDMRTSEICIARDGIILPANDPQWQIIGLPLYHHHCRTGLISLDPEEAAEFGGRTPADKLPTIPPGEGWGKPASWEDWRPEGSDYHPALYQEWANWTNGADYAHTREQWLENLGTSLKKRQILPLDAYLTIPRERASLDTQEAQAERVARQEAAQKANVEKEAARVQSDVRRVLDQWVLGSKRKTSVTLKKAAIAEFGLEGVAYSRVDWKIDQKSVEAMQPVARAIYQETQAGLKARFPNQNTVLLYRGVSDTYALTGVVESWTEDLATTQKFDGAAVLQQEIPLERILAYSGGPNWKNGKFGEQYEFVVLSEVPK